MREDEVDGGRGRQAELRHDRLEVVAVGAQAVQPDHRGLRVRAGGDLESLDGGHGYFFRRADLGRNAFTTASFVST